MCRNRRSHRNKKPLHPNKGVAPTHHSQRKPACNSEDLRRPKIINSNVKDSAVGMGAWPVPSSFSSLPLPLPLWDPLGLNSREGSGTPLQYSCLEHPMDRGAWKAAVHGVAECRTRLSDFTFTFHFHALEKEMATHSSVLAWRIPGMGEPGGLPSMGSHKIRHD